jgi:serine/threonine-protein kinase
MPAATLARLVDALSQSALLTSEQCASLLELQQACRGARELAREVLRRGWLTAYQMNQVARGRARDLMLGSYTILERLGEGGMGQIFKARQSSLGRILALKVIRPQFLVNDRVVKRFLREIQAASQLSHPNIVKAYDADHIEGAYYIAMELVEGIDLSRLVRQTGPLPVWQACDFIRQAALGLQHAFEQGLVHRDIKPANLLVASVVRGPSSVVKGKSAGTLPLTTDDGPRTTDHLLKITDFGLARWSDDGPERPMTNLTQVGSVLGTPDFISPEQTRNSSKCDIRSDIYSLGCNLLLPACRPAPVFRGHRGGQTAATSARHARAGRQGAAPTSHGRPWRRAVGRCW